MSKDLELVQQIEKESGMQLKQLQQLDQNTNQRGYVLNTDRMVTSLQLDQIRLNDWSFLQGLTSLTSLYLSDNKISDYSFLQGLTNLTSLDLSGNQIADASFLQGLTNLTSLDLSRNQISDASFLIDMRQLRRCGMEENQIRNLPNFIADLDLEIKWEDDYRGGIFLKDNPLETPPVEIVKQGREAVKNYFESLRAATTRLYEAKLLVVGQGNVGKTWLKQRLMFDWINPKTLSTEGIDINEWLVETAKSKDFKIHLWDFGGQEIYHATHQFFLTKRSLYLFVWEARTDDDLLSFDYWLNTIKILSDNAPVIVVQNKIDERKKSINLEGWKRRFPNIVDFQDVSAGKGLGTETLRDFIRQEICKLPHIGEILPQKWLDLRDRLKSLPENYIS